MSKKRYDEITCRCHDCGEVFDLSEVNDKLECPYCGARDNYEEVCICDECGAPFDALDEYTWGGLCEGCFEREATFPMQAIEYGEDRKQEVEINGLWANVYTPEQINEILAADFARIPDGSRNRYLMDFVSDDPQDFVDWTSERASV